MTTPPPCIIFICTDQQRWDSLGCAGNPHAPTPHLDALAAAGTRCTRFISTNTVCMPARASLLTGLHPSAHGVWTNGVPLPRRGYLPETSSEHGGLSAGEVAMSEVPTLMDRLNSGGWHTASVGKLHLTPTSAHPSLGYQETHQRWRDDPAMQQWHGPYYGFQQVELSLGHAECAGGHYQAWAMEKFPDAWRAAQQAAKSAPREFAHIQQLYRGGLVPEATQTAWCAERACAHIAARAQHAQPFFLWVGIGDPHHPFTPPAAVADQFATRPVQMPLAGHGSYADKPASLRALMKTGGGWWCPPEAVQRVRQYTDAMLHLIDNAVGRIVASLRQHGLWDRATIVFTSDHGDFLGDFGLLYKSMHATRALNHVPLLLRAPSAGLPPVIDRALSGTDLMPTLCSIAGVSTPQICQGEDIATVARAPRQRPVLVQQAGNDPTAVNLSLFTDQHRYTWYTHSNERELYDHQADPAEAVNLYAAQAGSATVRALHDQLCETMGWAWQPRHGRVSIW